MLKHFSVLALSATAAFAPPCVDAIAAAVKGSVTTPPSVTAPPLTGLPAVGALNAKGQPLDVYANGKMVWTTNFKYGGAVETDNVKGPDGNTAVLVTAQMGGSPPGGGGVQPGLGGSPNGPGNFDTTGSNFLTFVLAPTRPRQTWAGTFDQPGVSDTPVPGVSIPQIEKYCATPLVVNQYCVAKVPLSAIGMKPGQILVKLAIQDQDAWANAAQASGNQYYIYRVFFSAN